jgi:hypothetical protein
MQNSNSTGTKENDNHLQSILSGTLRKVLSPKEALFS